MRRLVAISVHHADSRDWLAECQPGSFDSCVTDPPYALESIRKRFGGANAAPAQHGKDGAFKRASRGFMGQEWDTGETAFDPAFWTECLRVIKPGGWLLAFGGTRRFHRLVSAIEDGGFEIRDSMAWLYGSGFPKSHNVGKAISALERTGGSAPQSLRRDRMGEDYKPTGQKDYRKGRAFGSVERDERGVELSAEAKPWQGWGTALKPAMELICVARAPLSEKTVAENVMRHGTGGINIDGCRIETDDPIPAFERNPNGARSWFNGGGSKRSGDSTGLGRWPANVAHDGSDDVLAAFPAGAARFFYTAKADADERLGSQHPTVKPIDLMRWLVRMVTPKNGIVLDPFAGTGTTGAAAMAEGFDAILIEREANFVADIRRRIAHATGESSPLFAGIAG